MPLNRIDYILTQTPKTEQVKVSSTSKPYRGGEFPYVQLLLYIEVGKLNISHVDQEQSQSTVGAGRVVSAKNEEALKRQYATIQFRPSNEHSKVKVTIRVGSPGPAHPGYGSAHARLSPLTC